MPQSRSQASEQTLQQFKALHAVCRALPVRKVILFAVPQVKTERQTTAEKTLIMH